MYQSQKFTTVVFTQSELNYWAPPAPQQTPFIPTLVHIESQDEPATILLQRPEGKPQIAARSLGWQSALAKAKRECFADLRAESRTNSDARQWWADFIGEPGEGAVPPSGLYIIPNESFRDTYASFTCLRPQPETAPAHFGAPAAASSGHTAVFRKTVNSSVGKADPRPAMQAPLGAATLEPVAPVDGGRGRGGRGRGGRGRGGRDSQGRGGRDGRGRSAGAEF